MKLDDPINKKFASWRSYQHYAQRVRHSRRYVWSDDIQAFLDTVLATVTDRDVTIPKGSILYRAQRGIDWRAVVDENGNAIGEEPIGYAARRMKPRVARALEGRANAVGIPVLYLATSDITATCEVRPWIGSEISVAQFRIIRDIKSLDLSKGHGESSFLRLTFDELSGEAIPDAARVEKLVWMDIDNAFSRPVTLSDDAADYVPTQILSELLRQAGYEAIIYRSQFGELGFNITLFNPDDAAVMNCAPYRVTAIKIEHEEIGSRWFARELMPEA